MKQARAMDWFAGFLGKVSLLVLVSLLGLLLTARAQIFSNQVANPFSGDSKIISDTSDKKKRLDDNIAIFSYSDHAPLYKGLDTSIDHLHRAPWAGAWLVDLGNLGNPAQNRWFTPDSNPAMASGFVAPTHYFFSAANQGYYNTTRPYTSLYYRLGSQQEQMLELFHTQNINERWNVAIRYAKVGSPGFYKLQKSNNDHLAITSHYVSANKRYDIKGQFFYNKLQQDEHGGIVDETQLGNPVFNNKRLLAVHAVNIGGRQNSSSIKNYYRQLDVQIAQEYFFTPRLTGDSVLNKGISLKHRLYTQQGFHRYRDYNPDTLFYAPLSVSSFLPADSVAVDYRFRRTGTALSVNGYWHLLGLPWHLEGGVGIEQETPDNAGFSPSFTNAYVFAAFNNITRNESDWRSQVQFKQYWQGNAAGNLLAEASVAKRNIRFFGSRTQQAAPYAFSYYASNYDTMQANVNRQSVTTLGVQGSKPSWPLFVTLQYRAIGQWLYRDSLWQTRQYDGVMGLWQASLQHTLRVKKLYWENDVAFQYIKANLPLHLPRLLWRSNLSYRNKLFHRKLELATGVEATYHTAYLIDAYVPYLNSFVPQSTRSISNKPRAAVYAQVKVKRFRGSVSVSDLQQLVVPNTLLYPGYAAPNTAIHFAFHWAFVN